MDTFRLIDKAREAQEAAYAPYSNFKVGAALASESGNIYIGCNVENSSLGLTICAERAAISRAVSCREYEFQAVAVVSSGGDYCFPCGACRQVISEFGKDIDVIAVNGKGDYMIKSIKELLPYSFKL